MRMPRNVRLFAWLYAASVVIGVTGDILTWRAVWTTHEVMIQLKIVTVFLVIFLVFFFPFFFLAVWRRKNWARWVLLIEFVGLIPLEFVMDIGKGAAFPMAAQTLQFVTDAIELLAFYFLFSSNAQPWFSHENSK